MVSIYNIKKYYLKLILILFLIFFIFIFVNKNYNNNNPKNKSDKYQEQTLKILLPPKELIKCPTTLYFKSPFENLKIKKNISKKLWLKSIKFTKNQKKYFVVFLGRFVNYKEKILKNDYHIIIDNHINTTFNLIWFCFSSKRLKNIYNFVIGNKFTKFIFFKELKYLFNKQNLKMIIVI